MTGGIRRRAMQMAGTTIGRKRLFEVEGFQLLVYLQDVVRRPCRCTDGVAGLHVVGFTFDGDAGLSPVDQPELDGVVVVQIERRIPAHAEDPQPGDVAPGRAIVLCKPAPRHADDVSRR